MSEHTDWRGTPIEIGCIVVYPGRASSSVWINEGVVVGFGERDAYYGDPIPTAIIQRTATTGYNRGPFKNKSKVDIDHLTVLARPGD
jgi:hypothetical protein